MHSQWDTYRAFAVGHVYTVRHYRVRDTVYISIDETGHRWDPLMDHLLYHFINVDIVPQQLQFVIGMGSRGDKQFSRYSQFKWIGEIVRMGDCIV